ncbi:MAG TPA: DUF1501 domain-containing protein [bacterium]|nr:DUF1501 domain-containing protein [bacterium]
MVFTENINRRDAIKCALLGSAGLALWDLREVWADVTVPPATVPQGKATAKSVIQIWMWGGPSHLDTFDPKPDAGNDYCGSLKNPIPTNVKGIQIGELLPLLAQQADKYSIIRSMTHGVNAHETASYMVQTGHSSEDRLVYPCLGAIVSLIKGFDGGYKGLVPPYIVLTEPQGRFSEAGFLGPRYKPFATGGDPSRNPFAVEGIVTEGLSEERRQGRRTLLKNLDTLGKVMPGTAPFDFFDECGHAADSIVAEAGKLFDLSQEKMELRERYGMSKFGQSCLMARRLVEQGVPYITINYNGWDTHKEHFEIMRRKLPEMDKGMSTLLQDLSDRELLDSTVVWWSGEFGRTPRIQWESPWNGGRGHYGKCFSAVLAGGGFKGGQVVGASDAKGEEVAERPVRPEDLLGSILALMGIDPQGKLPNAQGLDLQVMPSSQGTKGLLHEIM